MKEFYSFLLLVIMIVSDKSPTLVRAKALHFKIIDIHGFHNLYYTVFYKLFTHMLIITIKYTYFHNLVKGNQIVRGKRKRVVFSEK